MSSRTAILVFAFAASCAAAPSPRPAPPTPPPVRAPQAADDSEAQFRKMEAALAAAKKLTVEFKSVGDGASVSGTFAVDEGNKLEMKIQGTAGVRKYDLALKCDGAKMTLTRSETPPPPVPLEAQPELAAPPTLASSIAPALARGGAWLAQEFADAEYRAVAIAFFKERDRAKAAGGPPTPVSVAPRDVAALHTLGNFRPGKAEGGASAVMYDLIRTGEKPMLVTTFTVWIDSKTGLPAKREGRVFVTSEGKVTGDALSKWTETYTFK